MTGTLLKLSSIARHCVCGSREQPRSPLAARVAEAAEAVGVDLCRVSLRDVSGPLLADLGRMDDAGLCRRYGWTLLGRRNVTVGRWET